LDFNQNVSASFALPLRHIERGCSLKELAKPRDSPPQLDCRLHPHFLHQLGMMRFDRALGNAEHIGDLLIIVFFGASFFLRDV